MNIFARRLATSVDTRSPNSGPDQSRLPGRIDGRRDTLSLRGPGVQRGPDRGLSAHLSSGTLRVTPAPVRLTVPTESRPVGTVVSGA